MKNLLIYKLQVFLTFSMWIFKSKQERVKYFLYLLVPDSAFVLASFYISVYESGDYTNSNTLQGNNPWSMRIAQNPPVKVKDDGRGFAVYSSLNSAVYDYVHRQMVRFPSVMEKYKEDQQSFYVPKDEQTNFALGDAVKTAIISLVYEMVDTGWLGTSPAYNAANNYSTQVVYIARANEKDGKIYSGAKWQRMSYIYAGAFWLALVFVIVYFALFYNKKKKTLYVPKNPNG